jgi:hypothetical protein
MMKAMILKAVGECNLCHGLEFARHSTGWCGANNRFQTHFQRGDAGALRQSRWWAILAMTP